MRILDANELYYVSGGISQIAMKIAAAAVFATTTGLVSGIVACSISGYYLTQYAGLGVGISIGMLSGLTGFFFGGFGTFACAIGINKLCQQCCSDQSSSTVVPVTEASET